MSWYFISLRYWKSNNALKMHVAHPFDHLTRQASCFYLGLIQKHLGATDPFTDSY